MFAGGRERLHWSTPDPAAVRGTDEERRAAFRAVRDMLHGRIEAFVASTRSR